MSYLHNNTDLQKHGFLTSKNCVVDSKWVLKVTDFGFYDFHRLQNIKPNTLPLQGMYDLSVCVSIDKSIFILIFFFKRKNIYGRHQSYSN